MPSQYELTVGLEVHAELKTKTKIFCSCPTRYGAEPNTLCCPVCMGLPGALPVLNAAVVELAIRAGLATHCTIAPISTHDRKNYFYPDMPKAYQISQYGTPLCHDGYLDLDMPDGIRRIQIVRIHIEEDAGKLIHDPQKGTLLDFNRCGVPLIEIVSAPELHSADEARAYLRKLRTLLLYTDVSDCKMNEGSLRCDVNLSVRRVGASDLGIRTEIKNLNSIAFVGKAIEDEFARQVALLERGEPIVQETRRFDERSGKTVRMRLKENADDYRYFPEPDLPPIYTTQEQIEAIRRTLPRLPDERAAEYRSVYGLSRADAEQITAERAMADYFEAAAAHTEHTKILVGFLLTEIVRLAQGEPFFCPIAPAHLAELATLTGEATVNSSTAKALIAELWNHDQSPAALVRERGLAQINDRELLRSIVATILSNNPKILADYQSGKKNAAKTVIGQAMKQTGGRANPILLGKLVEQELNQ